VPTASLDSQVSAGLAWTFKLLENKHRDQHMSC